MGEVLSQPDPEWVIDRVIAENTIAELWGKKGAGKTFVGIDMAMSVALGQPWRGHTVNRQGPVLYILGEGRGGFKLRLRAWLDANEVGPDIYVPFAADLAPISFADKTQVKMLRREIDALREQHDGAPIPLTVVDTLNRTSAGWEENSNSDMREYVAVCDQIRAATDGSILVLHHPGHENSKRSRGASAWRAALHTIIRVAGDGPFGHLNKTTVSLEYHRDGGSFEDVVLSMRPYAGSLYGEQVSRIPTEEEISSNVYAFVDEHPRRNKKRVESGLRELGLEARSTAIRTAIDKHLEDGTIVNLGNAREYELVTASYLEGTLQEDDRQWEE